MSNRFISWSVSIGFLAIFTSLVPRAVYILKISKTAHFFVMPPSHRNLRFCALNLSVLLSKSDWKEILP